MIFAIEISNLTVHYPGYSIPVLDNISLSVKEGAISALIGPNGSGKSTLLKAVLGLIEYQGEIKVFGKKVEAAYPDIGYVPQRFSFDASFPVSVSEFIILAQRKNETDIESNLKRTLSYVDAEPLKEKKLSTLSGGQLQRVLLARALINRPKLLLLDEPEAGVDVGGEQTFYDLMEKLVKEKNLTALIASHELDVVYTYANEVFCVNRRLLCTGKPNAVLNQQTFEELYGRGLRFYGHEHARVERHHHA
jgi:ABC-type Mn2+/Zn2+ transport system ATPase subunit